MTSGELTKGAPGPAIGYGKSNAAHQFVRRSGRHEKAELELVGGQGPHSPRTRKLDLAAQQRQAQGQFGTGIRMAN